MPMMLTKAKQTRVSPSGAKTLEGTPKRPCLKSMALKMIMSPKRMIVYKAERM